MTPLSSSPGHRQGHLWLAVAGAFLALAVLALLASRGGSYQVVALQTEATAAPARPAELERRLDRLRPRGVYVVVDSHANRLRVYRSGELLREATCSTGSGTVLRDPKTGRVWVFETPRGERRVERKVRDPVWNKPDWAFIEEGLLPPSDPALRTDTFSLGEYGLYLGDGFIIHGTLFPSLLGQRLTHGCIRLGKEDLEYVYKTVPVGARVFLY